MSSTPETTMAAVPVKPALKQNNTSDDGFSNKPKHTTTTTTTTSTTKPKSSSGKKKKESRHLKWDEQKIQEHDKLRGSRMKIEEPNTPYHPYDSGSETDGSLSSARKHNDSSTQISWDALTNKLEAHAAAKEAYPSSPSSHGGNQTDEDNNNNYKDKELKHLEFKEHRKRHYNEMELVRKFRQEHPDGLLADNDNNNNEEDDDDDDNDADDENE
jgi:protein phosphatase inhibitor 2